MSKIARAGWMMIALVVLAAASAGAYTGESPTMQVRLAWPDATRLALLRSQPDLDLLRATPGEEIVLISHPEQVARLVALGFDVEVQIPDLEEYYAGQREGLRNFGDLYTYDEAVALLDEFHVLYPTITTAKFSIGTTWEGNTIWACKVSDNPEIDEDEPEVLFDALHHAREPITVNVVIETMRHLLESYGSDPEITGLVDQREIFFVPVLNVDGYLYNELTYPSGGGMWRKNRAINAGSSCLGVDPNRNYPYEWGGSGASADPCDETYRGPSAASEPCVQALMAFCQSRHFVTHDSYHSVVGTILFPWGYTSTHCPDDALFRQMAATMAQSCGYSYGTCWEMLSYLASGGTIDWTYAELGMFSFSTEVDGSGFWPYDSEVPGLVAENIPKNLYLIKAAGSHLTLIASELIGGDGDGLPDAGESLELVVTLQNEGVLLDAENVALMVTSDDPYLELATATAGIGTIGAGAQGSNAGAPLAFHVAEDCPVGHSLALTVTVSAEAFALDSPLSWPVGDLPVIFADGLESGAGDWTHAAVSGGYGDQWHLSGERNHTPGGTASWKFGDTGTGTYADLADGGLETPVLTVGATTQLTFWHWMEAEESSAYPNRAYDGGLLEVSRDGGPWEQVTPVGGYTHAIREGSQPGPFAGGTPVFSGAFDWRAETVALDGPPGTLQVRFRFGSDGSVNQEGWHVDDLELVGVVSPNRPPGAPLLASPEPGATVTVAAPALVVFNASDPDPGTTLTYGFQVFADALLTEPVTTASGIPEGGETTSWTVSPPLADGTYYWRAYADDGLERGPCLAAAPLTVAAGGAGVTDGATVPPLRLLGVWPNPSAGAATLRFALGQAGPVRAEIYDLQGRQVRALHGAFAPGARALIWDGRDARGASVPGGVYLYRLTLGEVRRTGRFLIVR